jgi:large subunit ribosomal protein L6
MSRVGKLPIAIPQGVQCHLSEQLITVKGKLGELSLKTHPMVSVLVEGGVITVSPLNMTNKARALWGTYNRCLAGMITGVHTGFQKELKLQGVGYRAAIVGKYLKMHLGYSHSVNFEIPEGISVVCKTTDTLVVSGYDKVRLGSFVRLVIAVRPPEPYKGKGILSNQYVRRKVGKKK